MKMSSLAAVFKLLSPTYVFADYRKKAADKTGGTQKRAERIITYNYRYLATSIAFLFTVGITDKWHD